MLGEVSVYIDMALDTSSEEGFVRRDLAVKAKVEHGRKWRARMAVAVAKGRIFDRRIVFGCVMYCRKIVLSRCMNSAELHQKMSANARL